MSLRNPSFYGPAILLFVATLFCGGNASFAQNSDVNLALHANSHVTAAEIGLPAYPGATLYKKDSNSDSAVDLGFSFGDFHFKVMAADYKTSDSPAEVFAFYRKALSRYGQVLECDHGKPVGSVTVTHSGLTCSDQHGGNLQVNGSANSSNDRELRAGSPHHYRVVGINKSTPKGTEFGLVYLELPENSSKTSQTK